MTPNERVPVLGFWLAYIPLLAYWAATYPLRWAGWLTWEPDWAARARAVVNVMVPITYSYKVTV